MVLDKYMYIVNYQDFKGDLCKMDIKSLLDFDMNKKVIFKDKKINPSLSPFIRSRIDIIYETTSFSKILENVRKDELVSHEFFIKYLSLEVDDPYIKQGKGLCKEIGLILHGFPSFKNPKTTFILTHYENKWYFGELINNNSKWKNHNNKPHSYSSSIGIILAKVLVNIAGKGDLTKRIIDPCCGVGTVILEGLYAGYDIVGSEINEKIAEDARSNIQHFNYSSKIMTRDIQDISEHYDVSIVDLPYGHFNNISPENQSMIIRNAKRISNKVVLVSHDDITDKIENENLIIIDKCKVPKCRKRDFKRYIWVCRGIK